ncbi:MAG: hypothetical protein E7277_08635 [Lachnospiraceae bacterium]|nr:hypothetical protein [Lachnospiraceae bacterium]
MTIEEQKKYLSDRLEIESLCASEQNKRQIEEFEQAESGDVIAKYLKEDAWIDDEERNTKVYIVRDKITKELVYFFAINCGILYSEIESLKLKENEREPFERVIKAIRDAKRKNLTQKQRDKAENEYSAAMENLFEMIDDPDRVSVLLSCAEDKALKKAEESELFSNTEEKEHTMNVDETFPAIDIKFLCRNKKYKLDIQLDFKLGVYVFWELIVPLLLEVAEMVGCKYVYLFAADNSDRTETKKTRPLMYTQDYDPYADEDEEEQNNVLRLVQYYQNELKFNFVTKYKILKPKYERTCLTLVQEVNKLSENRENVWLTHIEDNLGEG